MEETIQPQDHLGITGTEPLANTGPQGLPFQSHKTFHSSQDARLQDAPEAMEKISSREQVQEQMTCPKEAKGNSQDSGYSTAPESMVKFGQMIPPSPALAVSLCTQESRTQDVPEDMDFVCSNEQMQELMPFPKETKVNSQDSGYSTTPEDMVKFGQMIPHSPALAISLSPQDARTQDAPEDMVKFSSHEQVQEQIILPKEARVLSQESRYNTTPEAMVESGWTSHPSQSLATSPFTKDAINQDSPEAMTKSEGRISVAEPLWTILKNKAVNVVTRSCSNRAGQRTIMLTLQLHKWASIGPQISYCHLW
jgi:hypothetical protein